MSPFFTIVIPTYNAEKTISVVLDSIITQTFKNYEVVIIDGRSSDNSLKIISYFQEKWNNIRLISEHDKGIYDAMNKGIEIAKGEWLLFLGSDDILYNLRVLDQAMTKINANLGKKFFYGNVLINGDTGWAKDGEIYDGPFTIGKLLKRNISPQGIFYHKEVFKKIGVYKLNYKIWQTTI